MRRSPPKLTKCLKCVIIHQWVMLEGPESPKSAHKLVLPENVVDSTFLRVFLCERGSLNVNLVNVTLPPLPTLSLRVQVTNLF